ncbi:glycine zipper 2TM domain-containing protein [Erythrobacter sp. NE805]|uniref:glycine zipper 2TM domain-containing protein n=1 Tax=Erythrobacter sp. NE805 TaxID=3389875 RepID=UPI00396B3AB6
MKNLALLIAAGSVAATAVPAQALEFHAAPAPVVASYGVASDYGVDTANHDRRRWRDDRRYDGYRGRYDDRRYYEGDRGYWRGRDGRTYCRRKDGTTGLVIGAGAGALLGRQIDKRGDRTLGTILGAVGGGLLGREIDRGSRCR